MEEGQESKHEQETKPVEHERKEEQKHVQEKEKKPGIFSRLANKFMRYRRVLEIATKPDKDELISSIKVSVLGIALLGIIGFAIFLAYFLVVGLSG